MFVHMCNYMDSLSVNSCGGYAILSTPMERNMHYIYSVTDSSVEKC